jgi:hypothetical protein
MKRNLYFSILLVMLGAILAVSSCKKESRQVSKDISRNYEMLSTLNSFSPDLPVKYKVQMLKAFEQEISAFKQNQKITYTNKPATIARWEMETELNNLYAGGESEDNDFIYDTVSFSVQNIEIDEEGVPVLNAISYFTEYTKLLSYITTLNSSGTPLDLANIQIDSYDSTTTNFNAYLTLTAGVFVGNIRVIGPSQTPVPFNSSESYWAMTTSYVTDGADHHLTTKLNPNNSYFNDDYLVELQTPIENQGWPTNHDAFWFHGYSNVILSYIQLNQFLTDYHQFIIDEYQTPYGGGGIYVQRIQVESFNGWECNPPCYDPYGIFCWHNMIICQVKVTYIGDIE